MAPATRIWQRRSILAAGMDGIENRLDPGDPNSGNL